MATNDARLRSKESEVNAEPAPGDDGDVAQVHGRNYDPAHDQRDMRRLGKRQELKVPLDRSQKIGNTANDQQAPLPFLQYCRIRSSAWAYLGVCHRHLDLFAGKWRYSGSDMAGACRYGGIVLRHVVDGERFSEFASPKYQKQLSYAGGWLVCLGWQAAMPTVAYIGAQQTLALISVCNPSFIIQGWHGALLTAAYVLSAILFNTSAIGKLPILEGLAVVLHIFGFFAFLVIFWVMGPRANAEETFTTFADDNGWGSVGLATLIGMVGPTTTYLGGDSAVHLAEELKDASYILPRAMFVAAIINYVLGFLMTLTFMFAIGDIGADLLDPSGQPWVAVVYRITGSRAATIVLILIMVSHHKQDTRFHLRPRQFTTGNKGRQLLGSLPATAPLIPETHTLPPADRFAHLTGRRTQLTLRFGKMFMFFFCAVNQVTTSSRQVFAFARDKGLPFHKFLSKVNSKGVPSNSVYVTLAFTCILALIIIGSTTAFNIILSVTATGLFTSYLIVIGTVLVRKLRKGSFPASRFAIPRTLGICVNVIALCFLVVAFVFLFFPAAPNPNAAGMNWGILIYGAVTIIALLDYYFRGRHQYDGPVSYVRRELDYVEVK
ncbi:hypothetical protein LTR12_006262 [Friedmanniomyces endolithicus]|nr:hypothetical protein LTR12_006262 [Friedmanniomyces endolithicus]